MIALFQQTHLNYRKKHLCSSLFPTVNAYTVHEALCTKTYNESSNNDYCYDPFQRFLSKKEKRIDSMVDGTKLVLSEKTITQYL